MNFNLQCYFILLCCFVFLCFGCQRNHNSWYYPPSNYVGICGKMGKYSNGELPGKEERFTGYWKQTDSDGIISLEGFYNNGIPVGIWKSYHSYSQFPSHVVTYFSDGNYDEKSYYPDGMIMSQTKGRYQFASNSYSTIPKQEKWWDFDGNVINKASNSGVDFFAEGNKYPVEIFNTSSVLQDYHLSSYFHANGYHLELKIFLIPFKMKSAGVATLPLSFSLSGEVIPSNKEVKISKINSEGHYTLQLTDTAIKNSCLWFSFSVPELVEPINKFSVGIIIK